MNKKELLPKVKKNKCPRLVNGKEEDRIFYTPQFLKQMIADYYFGA